MTRFYTILRKNNRIYYIFGLIFILIFGLWTKSSSPSFTNIPTEVANTEKIPISSDLETREIVIIATSTPAVVKKKTVVEHVAVPPVIRLNMEIMAWIYPGNPTCGSSAEIGDGRKIDVLKPEYFKIREDGVLSLLTEKENGCNAYSAKNIALLRKHSKEQYATLSSSDSDHMRLFLGASESSSANIDTLVSFVVDNKMTGIEIDFEDFGRWSDELYLNYKKFVAQLGMSLHQNNKKLMIDGPAVSNSIEQEWYAWRYEDFTSLPVDRIVVMTYDYQYDYGAGQPVSPIPWIQDTIKWILSKFPNKSRLSFGIPSYGYRGTDGTQKFSLLTYQQMEKEPGFSTAKRDERSSEMTWHMDDMVYFYQDAESMSEKLRTIKDLGIPSVSVWHLGGNLWFK